MCAKNHLPYSALLNLFCQSALDSTRTKASILSAPYHPSESSWIRTEKDGIWIGSVARIRNSCWRQFFSNTRLNGDCQISLIRKKARWNLRNRTWPGCTFTGRTISNKCHAHNETDNVSTVDQRFWRKTPVSGSVKILIPRLSNMLITSRASRRVSAISRSNNEDRASARRIKGHAFTSPRMTSACPPCLAVMVIFYGPAVLISSTIVWSGTSLENRVEPASTAADGWRLRLVDEHQIRLV